MQIEKRKKRSQILNVKLFMGLREVDYRNAEFTMILNYEHNITSFISIESNSSSSSSIGISKRSSRSSDEQINQGETV